MPHLNQLKSRPPILLGSAQEGSQRTPQAYSLTSATQGSLGWVSRVTLDDTVEVGEPQLISVEEDASVAADQLTRPRRVVPFDNVSGRSVPSQGRDTREISGGQGAERNRYRSEDTDALRLPVLKTGVGDEVTVSATRGAVWRSTGACLGEAC